MNILVINGPNLNLLGLREKNIYGDQSYNDLVDFIKKISVQEKIEVEVFQSNHEGQIVDKIQAAYGKIDGILINPAAYTHTSIAILDALKAVQIKVVEVHLSDIYQRETFRHHSYISLVASKTYSGEGFLGYQKGLQYLKNIILKEEK